MDAIWTTPLLNVCHVRYLNISINCSPQTLFEKPLWLYDDSRKPLVKPLQLNILHECYSINTSIEWSSCMLLDNPSRKVQESFYLNLINWIFETNAICQFLTTTDCSSCKLFEHLFIYFCHKPYLNNSFRAKKTFSPKLNGSQNFFFSLKIAENRFWQLFSYPQFLDWSFAKNCNKPDKRLRLCQHCENWYFDISS